MIRSLILVRNVPEPVPVPLGMLGERSRLSAPGINDFILSRRRRTYNRVPKTDLGTLDFLMFEITLILGFSKIFEFLLTENRCVPIDSEATIGSVAATWIVSKTLKKKVRVRSGLVDQN